MHAPVDDLYLNVVLRCAHEQNAHSLQWVVSIGVANKNAVFAMLVGLAKRFEAQRSRGRSGGGGGSRVATLCAAPPTYRAGLL